jgi:hypothetical protein
VATQVIPIQSGERASGVARGFGGVETAAFAVVAHAVDVFATGHIGLAGHQAAVGKLAHAQRVGQLHPFHGVYVHAEVPLVHLLGLYAQQQGVKAGHHQALNVVGIAVLQGLPNRIAQAGHLGVAGPVKLGQRFVRLLGVALGVVGHVGPVNAAHVFTPAQNLAHKTFHRLQRRMAIVKSCLCRSQHLTWVDQLQVERTRQVRVIQPNFAFPHGVLVKPKAGQAVCDEFVQCHQRLCTRDGPTKLRDRAGVVREFVVDQTHHVLGDGVGCDASGQGQHARTLFAKAAAVVGIKVPLAANGFFAFHQNAIFLA